MTAQVESVLVKICVWLFFGVLFAVLPVLMDVLGEVTRGGRPEWSAAVDEGELLIAAAALSALSTADHFTQREATPRFWPTLLACAHVLLVVLCTAWYAHIGGLLRHGVAFDGGLVASGSARVFAGAAGIGLFSTVGVARGGLRHG